MLPDRELLFKIEAGEPITLADTLDGERYEELLFKSGVAKEALLDLSRIVYRTGAARGTSFSESLLDILNIIKSFKKS